MAGARAYNPEARITGVSLQPFIANPDFELLMGCKTDALRPGAAVRLGRDLRRGAP